MIIDSAKMLAFSLRELSRPKIEPTGVNIIEGRAWPWLCDYQRHINNARYLEIMDYGRTQFFLRAGLVPTLAKHGIGGVTAATQIIYRRPIDFMQTYRLETRLVGWDERWYLHEQHFLLADGRVAAHAFIRSMLSDKKGTVSMEYVLREAGLPTHQEPWSDELRTFLASTAEAARLC